MDLIYLNYKNQKYILLLLLGERNNKYCGIISDMIGNSEREKIIQRSHELSRLSLDRKIEWFRSHCPISFKSGFREIYTKNAIIINRYQVKQ